MRPYGKIGAAVGGVVETTLAKSLDQARRLVAPFHVVSVGTAERLIEETKFFADGIGIALVRTRTQHQLALAVRIAEQVEHARVPRQAAEIGLVAAGDFVL